MGKKQLNFIFRFTPTFESVNGMLFLYLRKENKTEYSTKEKILKSVSAYWLPFAAEWAEKDEKEVRSLALSSINQLQLHIQHIRETFDLPQPQWAYPSTENVNVESVSKEQSQEVLEEEIDYSSEDAEFGGNF